MWRFAVWVTAGCGATAVPSTPDDDMSALAELARAHREQVQASVDAGEIGPMEEAYRADWHAIADPCIGEISAECPPPSTTGAYGSAEWLEAATAEVDAHVDAHQLHTRFQDCWGSEDDHVHGLGELLDALTESWQECVELQ
ncbi:MAG: hypothetical protein ABMA64_27260 [Myxococcota bacterium]